MQPFQWVTSSRLINTQIQSTSSHRYLLSPASPLEMVPIHFWFHLSFGSGVNCTWPLPKCQPDQNLQVTAFSLHDPGVSFAPPRANARGISNARWWKARLLTCFCCDSSVFVSADSHLWDADFLKSFRILHYAYKRRHCLRLCPHLYFSVSSAKIVEMNFWSLLKISFNFR